MIGGLEARLYALEPFLNTVPLSEVEMKVEKHAGHGEGKYHLQTTAFHRGLEVSTAVRTFYSGLKSRS